MGLFNFLKRSEVTASPAATRHPLRRPPRETGGPVVQTGLRAGQNRTRTQTGQWRKKRADAG
jgi:hypothetical protein